MTCLFIVFNEFFYLSSAKRIYVRTENNDDEEVL